MVIYVVQSGDSVFSIAQRFGTSSEEIISSNEITQPDSLVIGQAIVIPVNSFTYQLQRGETLYSLSQRFNIPLSSIIEANPQITDPSNIPTGESIIIPSPPEKLRAILANGYAFPNIRNDVLENTLPYLSYLSPFSYQANEDGSLTPIMDERLISQAESWYTQPIMVVTNIDSQEGFSGSLANSIFSSDEVKSVFINNILSTIQNKGYRGVDIDFEYLYPSDRENYNNFLRELKSVLEPLGYTLNTALAPKISADQQGILYEAHDYHAQGEIVDHIIIMTYEWGYTYGPPMAVSPINSVRQVLEYAITEIPPEKILMGMPNYGYDWTLPYRPGTAAQTISNVGAVELARQVGAIIQYDENSQAPYFYYYDNNGSQHVVWFEDARSVDAKLRLIDEYGLGGVSYWTINRFFPQNWLIQNDLYNVEKLT